LSFQGLSGYSAEYCVYVCVCVCVCICVFIYRSE
jgi:hypothetical protein